MIDTNQNAARGCEEYVIGTSLCVVGTHRLGTPVPKSSENWGELGTPYNDIDFDIASTCRWSEVWICSARFVNLRNFEIAYRFRNCPPI